MENVKQMFMTASDRFSEVVIDPVTYAQLGLILLLLSICYFVCSRIKDRISLFADSANVDDLNIVRRMVRGLGKFMFPLLTILVLSLADELSYRFLGQSWLIRLALIVSMLVVFNIFIREHVRNDFIKLVFRWIALPLLLLHLVGWLDPLIEILESMSLTVGNIEISAYGLLRVTLFGSVLFWLGRASNRTGKDIIRRQEKLDLRAKEVASKLLEVGIFFTIFILLLQVMGINLTALAVFGGAVGVGLGFGLQSIASNFISGVIILMDRSILTNDYIELEDGRTGIVREMSLRSTTLETFEGKDIMVPNEKFITESFVNWTHNHQKQRYRVDFSVAYHSDVRKLVDIIKVVVASHEQVISGEEYPIEERPDCEIDSFGDSGINMFVEFWMYGIDDGKNRVGGDLLLMILEALQEHGYEIPFPQREVRVLNKSFEEKAS